MTLGATIWKGTIGTPQGTAPCTAAYSVPTIETIAVLGQTVKAYRFHLNLTVSAGGQNNVFVNDSWYAPNLGLVKQHVGFGSVSIDGTLKKYKIAK